LAAVTRFAPELVAKLRTKLSEMTTDAAYAKLKEVFSENLGGSCE
jgi:hypothetical protein